MRTRGHFGDHAAQAFHCAVMRGADNTELVKSGWANR